RDIGCPASRTNAGRLMPRALRSSAFTRSSSCLFPQYGPGPKHLRTIQLVDWQADLVREQPEQLLRGLIHSDGSRFMNRVRVNGTTYEYPDTTSRAPWTTSAGCSPPRVISWDRV